MAYLVIILPAAERDLVHLKLSTRRQVFRRLGWLADKAPRVIHHTVANMPPDLAGLCRLRVGDCRILYWVYPEQEMMKVYRIQRRREIYRVDCIASKECITTDAWRGPCPQPNDAETR